MITITPTKLKQLHYQERASKPFPSYLNFWSIEEDILIGVDLEMSLLYEFSGPDLFLKTDSEIENFYEQMKNIFHSIPENMTLQFVYQVRQGNESLIQEYLKNTETQNEMAKYIVEAKIKHFRDLNPYRKRQLLYLTLYPEDTDLNKMSVNIFKLLKPNYKKIAQGIHKKASEKLLQVAQTLSGSLSSLGINLKQLKEREIVELLYEYLNPGRAEYLDFNSLNKNLTLRSQVVFNACENQFDRCYLDGYYHRAVNMHTRPKEIIFSQVTDFLSQIKGEFDLCISVHSVNQDALIRQLQYNATLATVIGTLNPFKRYHEAELKAQHSSELVEYVKNTFQKLYQVSFCVVLRDRNLESLTQRANQTLSEFRTLGEAEGIIDDMNHLYLYLSLLPNMSQFNLRKHIFHTEAVLQFLPLHRTWTGSKSPKMLVLTRDNELLGLDFFDPELPAKHGIVLGTTGSGKSFSTNFLLTNFYIESEKNHIVIVDIGGSYRKLCKMFGGEYLEIELSERYGFNPFPPKNIAIASSEPFELDPDVIAYLKLLLQKLLKKDSLSGQESLILERAITNTYRYLKLEYDTPILSNLHYQLARYTPEGLPEDENLTPATIPDQEAREIAKRFAANLEEWTSGVKGKMINRRTSIEPKARMVVFDLQKLQEQRDLQSVVLFLIQNTIWQKLYDKSLQKIIVFDECWKLFNDPVSAELVENLYRTARKFNASVLSISQSPEDFLAAKTASAVLTNSYIKYILRLQKSHEVLNQFALNEQEIDVVKSLTSIRGKYSELLVKYMDKTQVLNILVPKADYWICTTDPEDLQTENKERKQNPQANELEILKKLAQ